MAPRLSRGDGNRRRSRPEIVDLPFDDDVMKYVSRERMLEVVEQLLLFER